jgi:probable F420-dependent oxidoreductase
VTLRLGLVTPVVSANPRTAAAWEAGAPGDLVEDLAEVVEAADLLGYHHLTCSEHVGVPRGAVSATGSPRGTRYHDPAVTLGWLAARTTRIRLATHVLVAGHHHPLAVAKTYGTLDVLSGGRVVLGVGVGSLHEEFDALGLPFEDRGERADDFLLALRAAWGEEEPSHDGPHFRFGGLVVDPCATTPDPRIWIGGRTARSLRRSLELGDGWGPLGLDDDGVARLVGRARDTGAWERRRRPFDVVLGVEGLDPLGEPDAVRARLVAAVAAGATCVNVRCRHRSPAELVEQLEAMAVLARELDGAPR